MFFEDFYVRGVDEYFVIQVSIRGSFVDIYLQFFLEDD